MLYAHPKVEQSSASIRFSGFDGQALTLAASCYLLTTNDSEYAAIREDLLLRILEIIQASGTGFALPSRTLYFTRDRGLDAKKSAETEQKVREWREHGELPFPDFNPSEIPGLKGQIVYPAAESAVRKDDGKKAGTE
jgi:MscS family membrane protein